VSFDQENHLDQPGKPGDSFEAVIREIIQVVEKGRTLTHWNHLQEIKMTYLYKERSKMLQITNRLKSFLIPNSLKRLSTQNELRDYGVMLVESNQKLWNLHANLEKIRHDSKENYKSYDYGNGYYYQSMKAINISGYRNTEERIEQLSLNSMVSGKSVLDIGTNSGFILLSLANIIAKGVGVELNPYLVTTGKEVQHYLGNNNIEFISSSFEDFNAHGQKFDVVLSLANHSTYDGNTRQSIDNYFKKISNLLTEDGKLIFESHPPQIEPKEKLKKTISIIESYFIIEEKPRVNMKGFLDRNRAYVIARKK
jgi:SAM-dependent methyltransferase